MMLVVVAMYTSDLEVEAIDLASAGLSKRGAQLWF
jgi:hypothetical protein